MPHPDTWNPYQSPALTHEDDGPREDPPGAVAFAWRVRVAALALALPMVCNLACIYTTERMLSVPPLWYGGLLVYNLLWMGGLVAAVLVAGPLALHRLAGWLHAWCGGTTSREAWFAALHGASWPLPLAAQAGGLVWMGWLYLYFYVHPPGIVVVSLALQAVAWGLGAWALAMPALAWRRAVLEAAERDSTHGEPPK